MKNQKFNRRLLLPILGVLFLCLLFVGGRYVKEHPLTKFNQTSSAKKQQEFDAYLNQLFSQEVTANTIHLHYTMKTPENYGILEYAVTYGTISGESHGANLTGMENVRATLASFKPQKLRLDQQLTYDILKDEITTQLSVADLYLYQEILSPSTGIQAQLPVLMAEYAFYREQDIKDYLALLQQTPDYFRQILLFQIEKANSGLFMPEFAAKDIIRQCQNFIADKKNNYLLDTFNNKINGMTQLNDEQKQSYIEQNQKAVTESFVPAYEMLMQGLEKLKLAGKNQQGLMHLPKGKEYYEYLVKTYTGSQKSVEEMQQATVQQRAKDMSEAAKLLSQHPQLLEQTTSYAFEQKDPVIILKDLQQKMQKDFPKPPDTEFAIKYVHPSLEEYMAPAFYLAVPMDDISQNAIYINGSNRYQKLKLYTTLAHEGYPGHLYQNIMERSQGFAAIRSILGTSGYSEGWATYVEMISYSYADVDSNLASLFQKDQAALLSLYASADMGIHYEGWSLAQMMDFFGEYQIKDEEILTEIYHLIIEEPAHYLKYYIGYLEFLELKAYAKKLYGEHYSDYQFHETLMKMGPAQFAVLKKYLPKYYNNAE